MKKWILFQVPQTTHAKLRLLAAAKGQPLCTLMADAAEALAMKGANTIISSVASLNSGDPEGTEIPHLNCYLGSDEGSVTEDVREGAAPQGDASSRPLASQVASTSGGSHD